MRELAGESGDRHGRGVGGRKTELIRVLMCIYGVATVSRID